ncbi:hypothetical protein DPMN_030184 [Dreissena polymorpha]|uniref:Uncharacterized protein n=1 Tax=Dreissena polymorpha TaxID=45954 RepID=A0A9D4RG53_DREPO|nr:hypothetical protein DPMN_030184 [Dreissena polymorpha]
MTFYAHILSPVFPQQGSPFISSAPTLSGSIQSPRGLTRSKTNMGKAVNGKDNGHAANGNG